MSASKMRQTNGQDGGGGKDLQVLQNEYKHMQVNRNAFANESELVRRFSMKLLNNSQAHFDRCPLSNPSITRRSYADNKRL